MVYILLVIVNGGQIMFQLTDKYYELINHYRDMACNGYHHDDGLFVNKTYGTAEPLKFKEEIKTIANHFKSKTALDYGSGGSDLNTEEISEGISFKDYVGLKKIYQFEPARDLKKKGKFDMVLSFDVLEHIFIADLPWVINDIFSKANKCVLINVACYEAAALLPNGENAHITLRHPLWWLGQIECISTLHKNIAWGLFTSQDYNEPKFHGIRRMNEIILNKSFKN